MKVYVVLWLNYGDQGVDFLGTFSTREKAAEFVSAREPDVNERQNYRIVESEVI